MNKLEKVNIFLKAIFDFNLISIMEFVEKNPEILDIKVYDYLEYDQEVRFEIFFPRLAKHRNFSSRFKHNVKYTDFTFFNLICDIQQMGDSIDIKEIGKTWEYVISSFSNFIHKYRQYVMGEDVWIASSLESLSCDKKINKNVNAVTKTEFIKLGVR